ncbi:flavin reductase [Anaeromicropila herbilytica]|uniref:Flavin reductase n=1 Tax=Anaeromicropila herbilytica TaxID=2785025 RepID=A0A7R7IE83_9FIRM|nr:flavin reductase [Anaeromicropila herbilytica]BCN32478.1 flavin reductase [Anaeromicropila herbilytica]
MAKFSEVKIEDLNINPFDIGKQWALVTAGDNDNFNTMTVSWGGMGVFWNKNVATIYIRPQRYTKQFIDQQATFTLSFYEEQYKESLALCGRVSGKDVDKVKEAKLTPCFEQEAPYFEEAKIVLVCKSLYHIDMKDGFFYAAEYEQKNYPNKDYHTMYIAEIEKVLVKE